MRVIADGHIESKTGIKNEWCSKSADRDSGSEVTLEFCSLILRGLEIINGFVERLLSTVYSFNSNTLFTGNCRGSRLLSHVKKGISVYIFL